MFPPKFFSFFLSLATLVAVCGLSTACAPKVYVIDRATLLEEESGGEWPQIDELQRKKLLKTSPAALKSLDGSTQKEKLTRILEPDESIPSDSKPVKR